MRDRRRKKKYLIKIACVLVFVLLLSGAAGCAGSPRDSAAMGGVESPAAMPEMEMAMEEMGEANFTSLQAGSTAYRVVNEEFHREFAAAAATSQRRYLVQSSNLTLEIADLEEAAEVIREGIEQTGGYIASLNFYDLNRERRWGQISLRVPADKYSQVMLWLQEQGETRNLEESSDDVTMQYIDLEARIGNLTAQEQRIRELLDKAKNIEEILQIEKELTRIRSDLESMQGEFKYLRERVTFSSIDVSLTERDPRESAVSGEFSTFGKELTRRFSLNTNRAIKGLTGLALAFLGSLPFLIILAVAGLIVWKLIRVIRRKSAGRPPGKDKIDESLHKDADV